MDGRGIGAGRGIGIGVGSGVGGFMGIGLGISTKPRLNIVVSIGLSANNEIHLFRYYIVNQKREVLL